MIIDSHCHIGKSTWSYVPPGEFTVEELLPRMREAEITYACCFSFWDWLDNDYTFRATQGHPELIPFAHINASHHNAVNELERCFKQLRFRGMKLNPQVHGYRVNHPPLMDPLMELCATYRAPVVAHILSDNCFTMPYNAMDLADRHPKVNIVMLHAGTRWGFFDAVEASRTRANLFIGTTNLPTALLAEGVNRIGAEKFVFECDAPYLDYVVEIAYARAALKQEKDQELVLGGNMARLLGLTQ
jgi:predicted TIM-barrel fold metal-dependent hydrolase